MLRALWFLVRIAVLVLVAVWLMDQPGRAVLDWNGRQLDAQIGVFAGMVLLLIATAAVVYRAWTALRHTPERVGDSWRGRRRQKGYQALTRGMVAVAAGDGDEARRQSKRADVLLNEPPLTMLLAAQAAQLNGDEKAAEQFFQAMTETEETEFLGLRGLLNQAVKTGDREAALDIARRAYRLRPKSAWVASHLFDLQIQNGQWLDAQVTSDDLVKTGAVSRDEARRRKAVLALQQAMEARRAGDPDVAAKKTKAAYDLDPAFGPAVVAHATALNAASKAKRATDIIEKAWRTAPHPDLLDPFWAAIGANDGLARMKATERLAAQNAGHPESHIALARAALEARLWGEARKNLTEISGVEAERVDEARVCRLWAALEEAEHEDTEAARRWLTRASLADADPAWVCDDCGNAVAAWSAVCGNCGGFDSFTWRTPRHVAPRLAEETGQLPVAIEAPTQS